MTPWKELGPKGYLGVRLPAVGREGADPPQATRHLAFADCLCLLLALAFLSYSLLRAIHVPFTHDESFSYSVYISKSLRAILTYDGPERANNHILNTLLAKGVSFFLGPSELALRLPNLIAHASFLLFSWLALRRMSPVVAVAGFVFVNSNPFMLEFFSLCRGYGLALGLLMPGVFFALRSLEANEGSPPYEAVSLVALGFGVLAQLVLLDIFLAMAAVFTLFRVARLVADGSVAAASRAARGVRESLPLVSVSLLFAVAVGPIVDFLVREGELYAGGVTGFWHDTVMSLIELSFLGARYGGRLAPPLGIMVGVLLVLVHLLAAAVRSRRLVGLLLLVDVAALATVAQHWLLGAHYLVNRTAVFFVPVVGLVVVESVASLELLGKAVARCVRLGACALALLALVHLGSVANVSRSYLWWFDNDTPEMLRDLEVLHRDHPLTRPFRLGVTWYLDPSINFYRATHSLDWLATVTRDSPWGAFDYVFLSPEDLPEARRRGYQLLRHYPTTGNDLYSLPKTSEP